MKVACNILMALAVRCLAKLDVYIMCHLTLVMFLHCLTLYKN